MCVWVGVSLELVHAIRRAVYCARMYVCKTYIYIGNAAAIYIAINNAIQSQEPDLCLLLVELGPRQLKMLQPTRLFITYRQSSGAHYP